VGLWDPVERAWEHIAFFRNVIHARAVNKEDIAVALTVDPYNRLQSDWAEDGHDCVVIPLSPGTIGWIQVLPTKGTSLTIVRLSGFVDFTFDDPANPPIPIHPTTTQAEICWVRRYRRVLCRWNNQPGSEMVLYAGKVSAP
jgi:hypothetical protein